MADGDVEALEASVGAFEALDVSESVQNRLNAVAANISDCADGDFFQ